MQLPARILIVCCLAAFCGAAGGQKIGRPAPEINAPDFFGKGKSLSIDRYRGKILVLAFWRADHKPSDQAIEILGRIHSRLGNKGVVILAMTADSKQVAERVIKEKSIRFQTGSGRGVQETYEVSSIPRVYLIDTLGTVVWKGSPTDDLEARIREQMIRTPPAGSDAALLRKKFSEAEALAKSGDLGRAFLLAGNVAEVAAKDSSLAKRAAKLKESLEKSAQKRLDEVRSALRSRKFEQAGTLAAMLSVYFSATEVGGETKPEVDRIRADSKGKDAYNKAVKAARAVRQTDQAAATEQSKQYKRAVEIYQEVVDKYADTEGSKTAAAAIKRINSDSAVKRHIKAVRADQQADRWLDIGERFDRLDMPEQAKEYYQKVIKSHPDSRAAKRASEMLKKLRG